MIEFVENEDIFAELGDWKLKWVYDTYGICEPDYEFRFYTHIMN